MSRNAQASTHLVFQVSERLHGRYARLSRRGRILLIGSAVVVLTWLLGLPQSLWRHMYVWLAYPPATLIDAITAPLGATGGHAQTIGWGAWTANIDARYAWLHTAAHGGLGGMIALEIALPFILCGVLAWRVGWFVYTRPKRLRPSQAHGSARWMRGPTIIGTVSYAMTESTPSGANS